MACHDIFLAEESFALIELSSWAPETTSVRVCANRPFPIQASDQGSRYREIPSFIPSERGWLSESSPRHQHSTKLFMAQYKESRSKHTFERDYCHCSAWPFSHRKHYIIWALKIFLCFSSSNAYIVDLIKNTHKCSQIWLSKTHYVNALAGDNVHQYVSYYQLY